MTIKHSFEKFMLRSLVNLPESVKNIVLGKEGVSIAGRHLDRQIEMFCYLNNKQPGLETIGLENARDMFNAFDHLDHEPVSGLKIRDRIITQNQQAIPVRYYQPLKSPANKSIVVYYHGGGWTIGSRDSHDRFCQLMCDQVGIPVLSVEYRLAPENPYPAAADDAFAAYQWVLDNHEDLGIDPNRVVVAGDSAGGNLAAVVSLMARDKGITLPEYQVLIYPVTDLRQNSESYAQFASGFVLTASIMDWFISSYVPVEEERLQAYASPLLAESLENLPPAIVTVAGYDPLYDDGETYADKLKASGVPVTLLKHESLSHGYVTMTGTVEAARTAVDEVFALLKQKVNGG